jgi:hypothetical protein
MIALTPDQCERLALESVGLSQTHFDVHSPEFLAAIVRAAAVAITPCTRRELSAYVLRHLTPLAPEHPWRDEIREAIEMLIALGDLVEVPDEDQESGRAALYLAPNSFVELSDGVFILLGGYEDVRRIIPEALGARLVHAWYTRRLEGRNAAEMRNILLDFGFLNLGVDFWLKSPDPISASDHVRRYDQVLFQREIRSAHIEDVSILDIATDVRRYSRRWSLLQNQKGRFVARRPQAYGSPLWCYMQVDNKSVLRHIDLPHFERRWMGYDEAWHLQLALDSINGNPQQFSISSSSETGKCVIDIYAPIPSWAVRRWNSLGSPRDSKGVWFSFAIQEQLLAAEIQFATERLWLRQV